MGVTSLGLAGEAGIFASLPFYPMFSGVPNGLLRLSPPQVHAAVHNSGVKVLSVDHKAGEITMLLPMHNAHVRAILTRDEPEIRVRLNEFYDARLVAGKVDTVKRNILRISIPEQRPAFFRVDKVTFLEK